MNGGFQSEKGDWCGWVAESAVADIPRGEGVSGGALWPDATISPLPLCGCARSITGDEAHLAGHNMNRKKNGVAVQGSHYCTRWLHVCRIQTFSALNLQTFSGQSESRMLTLRTRIFVLVCYPTAVVHHWCAFREMMPPMFKRAAAAAEFPLCAWST